MFSTLNLTTVAANRTLSMCIFILVYQVSRWVLRSQAARGSGELAALVLESLQLVPAETDQASDL